VHGGRHLGPEAVVKPVLGPVDALLEIDHRLGVAGTELAPDLDIDHRTGVHRPNSLSPDSAKQHKSAIPLIVI
jgi:hypothetical protein